MASRSILALLLSAVAVASAWPQLDEKFYSQTCPSVEDIVRKEMVRALSAAPSLAGPLLRMHFHDCFVRGCDGSVLLDSTANNTAEKDANPNQTLRGFGFIESVKAAVEKTCPDTVSCADVLALMARDAVWLSKGPFWAVPLGRRDGRVSISNETDQLPPPTANFTELTQLFSAKNLDIKDLVVLSAGHTIGTSHCLSFSDRLYNFTGMDNIHDIDPTLDMQYMAQLRTKCASLDDNTTLVEMDPGSFKTFDLGYYRNVLKRRGLFHSDGALLTDGFTRAYVQRHATGAYKEEFFADFAASMVKMGNVDVLTGSQGEIRKKCSVCNAHISGEPISHRPFSTLLDPTEDHRPLLRPSPPSCLGCLPFLDVQGAAAAASPGPGERPRGFAGGRAAGRLLQCDVPNRGGRRPRGDEADPAGGAHARAVSAPDALPRLLRSGLRRIDHAKVEEREGGEGRDAEPEHARVRRDREDQGQVGERLPAHRLMRGHHSHRGKRCCLLEQRAVVRRGDREERRQRHRGRVRQERPAAAGLQHRRREDLLQRQVPQLQGHRRPLRVPQHRVLALRGVPEAALQLHRQDGSGPVARRRLRGAAQEALPTPRRRGDQGAHGPRQRLHVRPELLPARARHEGPVPVRRQPPRRPRDEGLRREAGERVVAGRVLQRLRGGDGQDGAHRRAPRPSRGGQADLWHYCRLARFRVAHMHPFILRFSVYNVFFDLFNSD